MSAPNYQASDFAGAINALMPQGLAWPKDSTSVMGRVIAGLASTWARHTQANNNLLVDAFPATAVQLLPEWESTLGLPDPCAGESPTLQGRQQQVVARISNSGGQSIPFFYHQAALIGCSLVIEEHMPFVVGFSGMGDPLGGAEWAHVWTVWLPFNDMPGASQYWGNAVLKCEFETWSPAHTVLQFVDSAELYWMLDPSGADLLDQIVNVQLPAALQSL